MKIPTSVTRQGRTLSNDKGVNTSRRYNNYKCILPTPKLWNILRIKDHEGKIDNNTLIVKDFSTILPALDKIRQISVRKPQNRSMV